MTGGRRNVGTHCAGKVKTIGALVTPGLGLMLSIELFFALVKTHLHINFYGTCPVVLVIQTLSCKLFLTSLRRFSPKIPMSGRLCHGFTLKTIPVELLIVYEVSFIL